MYQEQYNRLELPCNLQGNLRYRIMKKKIRRIIGAVLILTSILFFLIPALDTEAVVLDPFQMDHDSLDKYEGTAITVSVPDDVKTIGAESFAGNQTLAQIDVGKNTRTIEHGAFANCPYLYSVTTHDNLEEIQTAAFAGDGRLTSINLGAAVSELGYGVFAGCNNLSSITISRNNDNFTYLNGALYDRDGEYLYAYLGGYTSTYYRMPNSVEGMSKYCFWGNNVLDSVSISPYIETIPAYAFSNCRNLKKVNIPYSVTTIDAKAFENCVSLVDVSIPASVSYIDPTAFDGCVNLNIIADPGTAAYEFFQNFDNSDVADAESGDVNVVIYPDEEDQKTNDNNDGTDYDESYTGSLVDASKDPSNVDYMPSYNPLDVVEENIVAKSLIVGGNAVLFYNPEVVVNGNDSDNTTPTDPTTTTHTDSDSDDTNETVIYDSAKGGYLPKYTRVDDRIATQAFYGNGKLNSYDIPSDVTYISDFAFARSALKSIDIPEGVTHIGYGAFYHCDNLTEVNIPKTVTDIEGYAFANTPYMAAAKANTQNNFIIVGDGILLSFTGNSDRVTIPEGVKKVAPGAFLDNTTLKAVSMPSTLTEIGEDAFRGCRNLSSVSLNEGLTTIGDRAFMECPLTSLAIPTSVKTIGLRAVDYSFSGKNAETKVVVLSGDSLPTVSYGKTSQRLENDEYRCDSLYNVLFAVVDSADVNLDGSVLKSPSGFSGVVLTKNRDSAGNETGSMSVVDSNIFSDEVLSSLPDTVDIDGSTYIIKDMDKVTLSDNKINDNPTKDLDVLFNGKMNENYTATLSEEHNVGTLCIDTNNDGVLESKYKELFGNNNEVKISAFDVKLTDSSGVVNIDKLGSSSINVSMQIPEGVKGDTYHAVTIDSDGQLEELKTIVNETYNTVDFTMSHMGKVGIYATGADNSSVILKSGKTVRNYKLDDSPNTGDMSLPIRAVISLGLFAAGLFLVVYKKRII